MKIKPRDFSFLKPTAFPVPSGVEIGCSNRATYTPPSNKDGKIECSRGRVVAFRHQSNSPLQMVCRVFSSAEGSEQDLSASIGCPKPASPEQSIHAPSKPRAMGKAPLSTKSAKILTEGKGGEVQTIAQVSQGEHLPVLDTRDVAMLLRATIQRVRSIPRAELPYMDKGAGRWNLYLLRDVIGYVHSGSRRQSPNMNLTEGSDPLDRVSDSVRGRSSQGERHE